MSIRKKKIIVRRQANGAGGLAAIPLLQRVYANRNIRSKDELETGLDVLPSPAALKGMDQAQKLLAEALQQKQHVLIVADFDADGATSCALAVRALRAFGAHRVSYVVPNRFAYGYGLSPEIVEVAAQKQPDLLITVDNGISSLDGVKAAKERGMRVLITDHHLPAARLPCADAIVNPNQPDDDFPSKNLAGVGVIFYVMLALRAYLREQNWFAGQNIREPNMARFLDLVAFGTIADVVPLDQINRVLVAQGLRRIRAGQCVPGIAALTDVARRSLERMVAGDIAFSLGPRLNAAGRLEDMSHGIRCLLSDDIKQARSMAWQLDQFNRERRDIELEMQTQALADLDRLHLDTDELPFGLCLFDENWHQGVIGILAARIRERTHRPVIAFAPDNQAGQLKGSARSVPNLHIRDVLDNVATGNPGLISKFGGHAMAAGLSLELEHLDAFRRAFDAQVRHYLSADDLKGVLFSDGELSAEELGLDSAEQLRAGGPWGQGFPEPLFDGVFDVVSQRIVGERHLKMVLRLAGRHETLIDAIAFNQVADWQGALPQQLRLAYRLDVNEWQGRRSPQLIVEHIETV